MSERLRGLGKPASRARMKSHLRGLAILAILGSITLSVAWLAKATEAGAANRGGVRLVIVLTNENVIPPVDEDVEVLAEFVWDVNARSLEFRLTVVSGVAGLTAAHIHHGEAGVNGPALVTLIQGDFREASGRVIVSEEFANLLTANELYIDVHSMARPEGAARAQILFPAEFGDILPPLIAVTQPPETATPRTRSAVTPPNTGGAGLKETRP